mmetsp:Transcript_61801/g.145349  ORF Transcript_61801/g.145349 Transcript_61801/m.145349 type:complete len:219 (-) Transcript_61801:1044-1700(-)
MLEGVAVDPALHHILALRHHILDGFHCNVLSLRKLEDVFLAIDDRHGSIQVPLSDVAGMQPPVVIEHALGLILEFVVALHHIVSADADFASRHRLAAHGAIIRPLECELALKELSARWVPVLGGILHLRDVDQLCLCARHQRPNCPDRVAAGTHRHRSARVLRHAVPLDDWSIERNLEEGVQIRAEGSSAREEELDVASEHFLQLSEENHVPDFPPPP